MASTLTWDKAGVTEADFHSLACLLRATRGDAVPTASAAPSQSAPDHDEVTMDTHQASRVSAALPRDPMIDEAVEEADEFDVIEQADDEVDDTADSIRVELGLTEFAPAGSPGRSPEEKRSIENYYDHLKKKLLDRIAELSSSHRNGRYVTCSALQVVDGTWVVFLTSNEGFSEARVQLLTGRLASDVRDLSRAFQVDDRNAHQERLSRQLWQTVLACSSERVGAHHLTEYRKAYDALHLKHSKASPKAQISNLACLRDLCNFPERNEKHTFVEEACDIAYTIRKDAGVLTWLKTLEQHGLANKLWKHICFIARAKSAYMLIIQAAKHMEALQSLAIRCLPKSGLDHPLAPTSHSFQQCCKINLSSVSTKSSTHEKYDKLIKEPKHVHAEIQLLYSLESISGIFPYLGGSKYCCVLCWLFVRNHGYFETRGTHDGLFTRWKLPGVPVANTETAHRCIIALSETFKELKRLIQADCGDKYVEAKAQSSKGETDSEFRYPSQHYNGLEWRRHIDAEQQKRISAEERDFEHAFGELEGQHGLCYVCDRPTHHLCQTCGADLVCDGVCSRQYSPRHPTHCLKKYMDYRPFLQCAVCGREAVKICRMCRSAAYCSSQCYRQDADLHDRLCEQYATVVYSRPEPPPTFRLAFHFPSDKSAVECLWIQVRSNFDQLDRVRYESIQFGNILGDDRPATDIRKVQRSIASERNLGRTIEVNIRDAALKDGSAVNQSIVCCLKASSRSIWKGPCIVMRQPGIAIDPLTYTNVRMEDMTIVTEYFYAFAETSVETSDSVQHQPGPKLNAIRINCEFDRNVLGREPFENVKIADSALMRHTCVVSDIGSRLLGKQLYLQEMDFESIEPHEPTDDLSNRNAMLLLTQIDPSSDFWGFSVHPDHPIWDDSTQYNYVCYHRNDSELSLEVINDLVEYCRRLKPEFENACLAGLVARTREEVMDMITPSRFAGFRQSSERRDDD